MQKRRYTTHKIADVAAPAVAGSLGKHAHSCNIGNLLSFMTATSCHAERIVLHQWDGSVRLRTRGSAWGQPTSGNGSLRRSQSWQHRLLCKTQIPDYTIWAVS